jgi:hypothetical protein
MMRSIKGFNVLTMVSYITLTNVTVFGSIAYFSPSDNVSILNTFTLRDNIMTAITAFVGLLALAAK